MPENYGDATHSAVAYVSNQLHFHHYFRLISP